MNSTAFAAWVAVKITKLGVNHRNSVQSTSDNPNLQFQLLTFSAQESRQACESIRFFRSVRAEVSGETEIIGYQHSSVKSQPEREFNKYQCKFQSHNKLLHISC